MVESKLPSSEGILEELANKAAEQIGRLAPLAFDDALDEMTAYHRFMLELTTSKSPDGITFSFADISGDSLVKPHRNWIAQWRRLFERAANCLPEDDHFICRLAYEPSALLPGSNDIELPEEIVRAILDLGPMMIHRLEAWITKRKTAQFSADGDHRQQYVLARSDEKAYADVLPEIIGAWEQNIDSAPLIRSWDKYREENETRRWSFFQKNWPFFWKHLENTACCLALTVWYEDEIGAAYFRDSLVRWPQRFAYRLDEEAPLKHRRLLFPSLLTLDWEEASKRVSTIGYDYFEPPTPDHLLASIIRIAHDDIVLLTSVLLLHWTTQKKQASDIGTRTAKDLLRRATGQEDAATTSDRNLPFCSWFLSLLHQEMVGGNPHSRYAGDLDRFVVMLDNITESHTIPGRTYTPSTLNNRRGLLLANISLLLAAMPHRGDDGLGDRIASLATAEDVLPEDDASLRSVVQVLERVRAALEPIRPEVSQGANAIFPGRTVHGATSRLSTIVASAIATIEDKRLSRLKAQRVDPDRIEGIRSEIEIALLDGSPETPFFRGVTVEPASVEDDAKTEERSFSAIDKAELTSPPMVPTSFDLDKFIVSSVTKAAGARAWQEFCRRDALAESVSASPAEKMFWHELAPALSIVGPDPVLVVSRWPGGKTWRHLLSGRTEVDPNLSFERKGSVGTPQRYIATVEGVDIYDIDLPPEKALLFSGRALRTIRYAELGSIGRFVAVEVKFDSVEGTKIDLTVKFRQCLEWAATPIFELDLRKPD